MPFCEFVILINSSVIPKFIADRIILGLCMHLSAIQISWCSVWVLTFCVEFSILMEVDVWLVSSYCNVTEF